MRQQYRILHASMVYAGCSLIARIPAVARHATHKRSKLIHLIQHQQLIFASLSVNVRLLLQPHLLYGFNNQNIYKVHKEHEHEVYTISATQPPRSFPLLIGFLYLFIQSIDRSQIKHIRSNKRHNLNRKAESNWHQHKYASSN